MEYKSISNKIKYNEEKKKKVAMVWKPPWEIILNDQNDERYTKKIRNEVELSRYKLAIK